MYRMLIDGELVSADRFRDVLSPVDETIVASVPDADIAMMDRAVAAARRAWPAWRDTAIEQRAAVLKRMSAIVSEHASELASLLIKETGRPQGVAAFEMGLCTQFLDFFSEQRLYPELIIDEPHRRVEAHRKSLACLIHRGG